MAAGRDLGYDRTGNILGKEEDICDCMRDCMYHRNLGNVSPLPSVPVHTSMIRSTHILCRRDLCMGWLWRCSRRTMIAKSQRGQSTVRSQFCYSSFLAVTAELHRNDSVHVVVRPCSSVQRSPSASQLGVFRIVWNWQQTTNSSLSPVHVVWGGFKRWRRPSVCLSVVNNDA